MNARACSRPNHMPNTPEANITNAAGRRKVSSYRGRASIGLHFVGGSKVLPHPRMIVYPAQETHMKPPYLGFRLVFALVNALLWFGIAYGVTSGLSVQVEAAGRLHSQSVLIFAACVAFFVCFFGLPDAYGGFLKQAQAGRFELPLPPKSPASGRLSHIIRLAAMRGIASATVAVFVAFAWLERAGVPSRNTLCLDLGIMAAILAFGHNLHMTGPKFLSDLRRADSPASPPSARYWLLRFGLPQGFGNGLITGLLAWGAWSGPKMPTEVALDAGMTTLVLAGLMSLLAGSLAPVDLMFGHVVSIQEKPHAWWLRGLGGLGLSVAAGMLGLALGGIGLGAEPMAFVLWKLCLGAGVSGLVAMRAARWKLWVQP